ncbi:MAG: chemotaxis protein CheX [Armatimonadetes bacterium]|nr:chemotaxis protein CheX [Armatimonadota bacterium]
MMKVEYVNPFISAAFNVLEIVLGAKPERGQLAMRPATFTSQQCTIVTGVTGRIQGQILYGMSLVTADRVASGMLGQPIRTFDQLAASAIAELGNMITGNAMSILAEKGYICDITPPSIIRGSNVKISTLSVPALVVPIVFEQGEMEINVCMEERA